MLRFERQNVLVHRRQRSQVQPFGDLLIAGAIAALFEKARKEVEKLLLPFGKCHMNIVGEEKGNFKAILFTYVALLFFIYGASPLRLRARLSGLLLAAGQRRETAERSRLRGNPDHPVTRGFLCGKVAQYLEREYSPRAAALSAKAHRRKGRRPIRSASPGTKRSTRSPSGCSGVAREFGPEAILPYSYAGTMGMLNGSGMDRRFFHRLGASRLDRTICSSAGSAGLTATLGLRYGTEPEQFRHAKLIIAWAANIHGTNVHLWPFIVEARRNGAKLYVIDPIRTRTAALADRHSAHQSRAAIWRSRSA